PSVVSLSKITLEKRGDKVSLAKKGSAGHGRIVCNLRWRSGGDNAPKPTGLRSLFGKGKSGGVDLDLGCLFEMADGAKSVVQALGGLFGAYDQRPYIQLAGDDRTGQSVEGEFLYINGDRLKEIRRVCVYAFIYEGVPNWAQADGFVTLTVPGHPPVEVRMDGTDNRGSLCAIAMIENDGGELKVTKLAEYFSGQQELDARYGWGMQWQRGSKS
ncbi:MAG: tellurium resistance protein, partial [Pseudomonadota bacterium]